MILSCELCSAPKLYCFFGVFTRALLAQAGSKIKLIANEDIDVGKLKLAPAVDRMSIEKAAPEITDGRPIIKNTEDGVIELIVLSTTFEHKGSRWAVVMRSKRGIGSANDGRQPSGTPFWFGKCVPQGIHNCEIEVVNQTVPGLIVAIPIATNTSEIKKGDQIMVWNPFTMPPKPEHGGDAAAPPESTDEGGALDGGKGGRGGKGKGGRVGKGGCDGKGKPKSKGGGGDSVGDGQAAPKRARKS